MTHRGFLLLADPGPRVHTVAHVVLRAYAPFCFITRAHTFQLFSRWLTYRVWPYVWPHVSNFAESQVAVMDVGRFLSVLLNSLYLWNERSVIG